MKLFNKYILLAALLHFSACNVANSDDEKSYNTYFPLGDHLFWEYELTYSDRDPERPEFPYSMQFTTRIIDKVKVNQNYYYKIENYFITRTPSPGDVALIRESEDNILIFFEGEDHLFYSFDEIEAQWTLPLYENEARTKIWNYWSQITSINDEEVIIQWSMFKDIGRSHLIWEEHFKKGTGRTKVVLKTQVYGKAIWELTNTNVNQGGSP